MESKSVEWIYTLEHQLKPQRLMKIIKKAPYQSDVDSELETGISMFKPYFVERLGLSHTQAKTALLQLVIASDKVYDFLITTSKYQKEGEPIESIRRRYLKILAQIETLLEDCGKIESNIVGHIPLTLHSVVNVRLLLRQRLAILQGKIIIADIDEELSSLLVRCLHILISKKGISRAEVSYMFTVMDALNSSESLNTSALEDMLCEWGFNTPTFLNYWINYCNKLLQDEPNLHRQIEILIGIEDRVNGLSPKEKSRCVVDDEPICVQLKGFLKEKKRYVNQQIKLRRSELRDSKLAESGGRILFNLSVAQFGLLIRLFMENGLLLKEDIRRTFAHFAANFRTPKTAVMSAESLQKKSTDVEFAVARKMKGVLIGMVNWLNEHYNTPRDNEPNP